MTSRIFSIPVGVPFLPTLAERLCDGTLVPGFSAGDDPLALAHATIFVPTRRAARTLRAIFVERCAAGAAFLPDIRPLGELDEAAAAFEFGADALALAPPIGGMDRLLMLAPLVQQWRRRLPSHIAARFEEAVTIPASAADAVWLARDLAALIDEVETEEADWQGLAGLAPEELAGWWQVTRDFLAIVTDHLPQMLDAQARSSPGAHRSALIDLEARRLARNPPAGPVIAAGSTGSIPATARLLAVIARLEQGAVVLPGLDTALDEDAWKAIERSETPAVHGHPQHGLCRLLPQLGAARADVVEIDRPEPDLAARAVLVSHALRPAETTDSWVAARDVGDALIEQGALERVSLIEAASEREEAAAIAVALRLAIAEPGRSAALVTGDRELARRVAVELARFGILADDSAGRQLSLCPAASLLRLVVETTLRPGDPVALVELLKHPLLHCGQSRPAVRHAAETVELIAFRGGSGRPILGELKTHFERRLAALASDPHRPFWLARMSEADLDAARDLVERLHAALEPLAALRETKDQSVVAMAAASVRALEAAGIDEEGSFGGLYGGDAGAGLVEFLRELCATDNPFRFDAAEWPDILAALMAGEVVKPTPGADQRVAIWGALEARLQTVDTLVLGGLNEGSWPRRAEPDRFMSRMMKAGLSLSPPERRIGQAAHDFAMAMGNAEIVLSRALRAGDSPSVASRWMQRLLAFSGETASADMRHRGRAYIHWSDTLYRGDPVAPAERPAPTPPLEARPQRFSVTEIETLRRDPYAIYARRILKLHPLDPLIRDPGAMERGNLFHDILHAFTASGTDPASSQAGPHLLEIGRASFEAASLPSDVHAVWWPRFEAMAAGFLDWERTQRPYGIAEKLAETRADPLPIGATGATLSGRADRIDILASGMADILDYKTGSWPSKAQAHTLLSPQLALEGALLLRGGFAQAGSRTPSQLAHVRLKPGGEVVEESILEYRRQPRSAEDLALEAWTRLERLVAHYRKRSNGYNSRALPFREGDVSGYYDHLARVLEWSAGASADAPE